MAAERLSMRKTREILRLKAAGLSNRQIAGSIRVSHSTVGAVLRRAADAGVSWPLPEGLDEHVLLGKLYGGPKALGTRSEPNCRHIHSELKRKGVTLMLLWQEYIQMCPDGYRYTQFCVRYRKWQGRLKLSLRQSHKAGEKMFVDYAGPTVGVVAGARSGEIRQAQIFVAVLGASNYTYVEATWSQELSCWIGSHTRAFAFFGGVPAIVVPDNLKSGVTKACRYEPDINPTYQDMAAHYGCAVIPARAAKPKDKAKVEVGVQVVERWILARLRNRVFFSLGELNETIAELLSDLNDRRFVKLEGTRRSLYEKLEKPALLPLPGTTYEFASWKKARVNIDYHIEIDHHYYSVPHQLLGSALDVRLTGGVVEIFQGGRRITSHVRSFVRGAHTTKAEHRPRSHREYLEWTPSRIVSWAGAIGPHAGGLCAAILKSRPRPEHGFRSCLGLIRLAKRYPSERVEAACGIALGAEAHSYKSVKSILERGLDQLASTGDEPHMPALIHDNIRGTDYYN